MEGTQLHPGRKGQGAADVYAAIRCNPGLKRKYEALRAAGKPPKVALTAIMRKLVILANALV